jgi:hypothetical protein
MSGLPADPSGRRRDRRLRTRGALRVPPRFTQRVDCGPKGIRTPDLMAASQPGLIGVLTCEDAGRHRPNTALLSAQEHQGGAGGARRTMRTPGLPLAGPQSEALPRRPSRCHAVPPMRHGWCHWPTERPRHVCLSCTRRTRPARSRWTTSNSCATRSDDARRRPRNGCGR